MVATTATTTPFDAKDVNDQVNKTISQDGLLMRMATAKGDRLQIRVDPDEQRLLERAAAARHLSVSAFVLQSASAEAATVLADRSLIALSPDAAAAFSDALERPATVNEQLAEASEHPLRFRWID